MHFTLSAYQLDDFQTFGNLILVITLNILQIRTIKTINFQGYTRAADVKKQVGEAMAWVGVNLDQILAATVDNASNMTAGVSLLSDDLKTGSVPKVSCLIHDEDDLRTLLLEPPQPGPSVPPPAPPILAETMHDLLSNCEAEEEEQIRISNELEREVSRQATSTSPIQSHILARLQTNVMNAAVFDHERTDMDGK